MPIDPVSLFFTLKGILPFLSGAPRQVVLNVAADGAASFHFPTSKNPQRQRELDALAVQITRYIRGGAPPEEAKGGRAGSPFSRRVWQQLAAEVAQVRDDFLAGEEPEPGPEPLPEDAGIPRFDPGPFTSTERTLRIESPLRQRAPVDLEAFMPALTRPRFAKGVPGGVAGFNQQAHAAKLSLVRGTRPGGGSNGTRRRRRSVARAAPARRRTRRVSMAARMVKGSPAAKRHMARLRAMVGRRRKKG